MIKVKNNRDGFTLLLSLVITGVILSIGLGVFEIVSKEIRISGVGRESQIAFYAANSGLECAFYQEIINDAFGVNPISPLECGGGKVPVTETRAENKFDFSYDLGDNSNSRCVKIKVVVDNNSNPKKTVIESRGSNMTCNSSSPHKVERAVRLTLKKEA